MAPAAAPRCSCPWRSAAPDELWRRLIGAGLRRASPATGFRARPPATLKQVSDFSAGLKARADLPAIVGETVALRQAGDRWLGLCPFHAEKTPSFHVHAVKQFYYCFGCQAHGDVYQFLMATRQLSFPEAVAALAERLGVPLPADLGSGGGANAAVRAPLAKLHTAAARFFAAQLAAPAAAAARAYLDGRGVAPAAIARFQLGYAPGSGRELANWLERHHQSPALALASGLCQWRRQNAGAAVPGDPAWDDLYDRFRDRVMFPIADERGQVIAFGGRALAADPAHPAPKYLNSPETPLYTKGRVLYNLDRAREAIRRLGYFILVEGYLDCLSVFMAGFENVVASCGTALTGAQVHLLTRYAQNAVVNFDPDAAGAGAAEKSIGLLLEEGCKIRAVTLPGGLDPDQFLRQQGRDAYAEMLRASPGYFDFLAGRARRRFDLRRAEGRAAALNFLLPYVARVQDAMIRTELTDELADQLQLESAVERRQLRQAAVQRRASLAGPEAPGGTAPATGWGDLLPAERIILQALLQWGPEHGAQRAALAAALNGERDGEPLLAGLASQPLVAALTAAAADPAPDLAAVAAALEPADRQLLAMVSFAPGAIEPLSPAAIAGAVDALRQRCRQRRRRELEQQLRQTDRHREPDRYKALLTEMLALAQSLDPSGPAPHPRSAAAGS